MKRLTDTDLWHVTYRVRPGWSATYCVVPASHKKALPNPKPGDAASILRLLARGLSDPRNPDSFQRGFVGVLHTASVIEGAPTAHLTPAAHLTSAVHLTSAITPAPTTAAPAPTTAAPATTPTPTVRQMLRIRHYGKEPDTSMAASPLTPPKIPRPSAAPRAKTTATSSLKSQLRKARAEARQGSIDAQECQRRVEAAVECFWDGVAARTPVIVPDPTSERHAFVSFFWRDAKARAVLLFANRITDEKNLAESLMRRVPGTDVWHITYRMETDWRASYCFIPCYDKQSVADITGVHQISIRKALDRGMADPRNPLRCQNRAGNTLSVAELDDAPPQPWLGIGKKGAERGRVSSHELAEGYTAWVYEPPMNGKGKASANSTNSTNSANSVDQPAGALIMFDGDMWMCTGRFHETLDNLIGAGRIPPVYGLLLGTDDIAKRWQDLNEDSGIDEYITGVLLPWARRRFPITTNPDRVIIAGQSLGALSALWTGIRHPESVRNVISQSASLWRGSLMERLSNDEDPLARGLAGRLYLEVGKQEWVLRPYHQKLAQILGHSARKGRDDFIHKYVEYNGGHDYACWRGGIADALCWVTDHW
jgi:enterochelin esterase family protein